MTGGKVLIVDDDREIVEALAELMRRQGLTPVLAKDGDSALECIRREHPDVLLVDFQMPGKNGLEVMQTAKALDEDLPVVLLTGFAEVRGAVEAIRAGAHDYLAKPFEHHEVMRVVLRALTERNLRRQLRTLSSQVCQQGPLREILGPSEAATKLIGAIQQVAKSDFSVVVLGETGSGKEVVSRAIHQASLRSRQPFVPVDCGAIPEALLESELFGHERGAFTGADQQKPGMFETASGGTLFLDEVSNLPLPSQVKLLRVLQEKTLYRLGGTKPIRVDARVVAASNDDLQTLVDKGSFRRDLYFRLNEFAIHVPPLRQRREDIPYLAKHFIDITNIELSKQVKGIARCALEAMLAYHWPGNVRQLRSVIRRGVLMAEDTVTAEHLALHQPTPMQPPFALAEETDQESGSLREIVRRHTVSIERGIIARTLRQMGGNKTKTARLLQIDFKTLHSKLKEYGIESNGDTSWPRKPAEPERKLRPADSASEAF